MKKDIAKKWIKALRSGKYTRGESYLKQEINGKTKHCCLGVLCEIYNETMKKSHKKILTLTLKRHNITNTKADSVWYFEGIEGHLPRKVRIWSGIRTCVADYREPTEHIGGTLSDLNDTGHSFNKIATVIEKNIDNL